MLRQRLATIVILLSAIVLACSAALLNGYPFVYPDTGTYLDSGFEATPPYDRTIFYGLFARHISLFTSLWLVVIAQAIIICSLLYCFTGIFFSGTKRTIAFLSATVLIVVCTQFSFDVGYLIPDLFTPVTWLCMCILLFHQSLNKFERIIIAVVFCYSISMQVSTFGILLLTLLCIAIVLLIQKIFKKNFFIEFRKFVLVSVLLTATWIAAPFTHYCLGGKFTLSNGSHVFIMNHFLETGILKTYLDENCDKKKLNICAYKDHLGYNLMWEPEGPLYKTGGWEANRSEYNAIIKDILTTPVYAKQVFREGVKSSISQLGTYSITVAEPQLEGTAPWGQINWRFKKELPAYMSSKQSRNTLNLDLINVIHRWLIPVSALLLLGVVFFSRLFRLPRVLSVVILLLFAYTLCNAIICANFSTIDNRYMHRIVWVFPFLLVVTIAQFVFRVRDTKGHARARMDQQ